MRLSEYIEIYKKFGLLNTLIEIRLRFYSRIERKFIHKRDKETFNYLKKYLNTASYRDSFFMPLKDQKPCIWTLWLQGYDNAPPIVKKCINSMRRYSGKFEVIVLTEDSICEYVSIPEFILQKYKSGIIQNAHFSDIIRTLILINYGGIWLDATVYLTKNIPSDILSSDFFMFQSSLLHTELIPCSNWFIVSNKNNPVLVKTLSILFEYWKNNDYLLHYFIFHITVGVLITYDEEVKYLWKNMFYKNNSDPHLLQKKLFDLYDQTMKNYIWELSFSHKLTYKFNDNSTISHNNTYYQHILEDTIF